MGGGTKWNLVTASLETLAHGGSSNSLHNTVKYIRAPNSNFAFLNSKFASSSLELTKLSQQNTIMHNERTQNA